MNFFFFRNSRLQIQQLTLSFSVDRKEQGSAMTNVYILFSISSTKTWVNKKRSYWVLQNQYKSTKTKANSFCYSYSYRPKTIYFTAKLFNKNLSQNLRLSLERFRRSCFINLLLFFPMKRWRVKTVVDLNVRSKVIMKYPTYFSIKEFWLDKWL